MLVYLVPTYHVDNTVDTALPHSQVGTVPYRACRYLLYVPTLYHLCSSMVEMVDRQKSQHPDTPHQFTLMFKLGRKSNRIVLESLIFFVYKKRNQNRFYCTLLSSEQNLRSLFQHLILNRGIVESYSFFWIGACLWFGGLSLKTFFMLCYCQVVEFQRLHPSQDKTSTIPTYLNRKQVRFLQLDVIFKYQ